MEMLPATKSSCVISPWAGTKLEKKLCKLRLRELPSRTCQSGGTWKVSRVSSNGPCSTSKGSAPMAVSATSLTCVPSCSCGVPCRAASKAIEAAASSRTNLALLTLWLPQANWIDVDSFGCLVGFLQGEFDVFE